MYRFIVSLSLAMYFIFWVYYITHRVFGGENQIVLNEISYLNETAQ